MLHPQPMQQRDQTTPALVGDAAFGLDPGADLAGCPRQRLGDPALQLVLLRIAQAARAAAETKARQTLDAVFLIQSIPRADGVVVEEQDLRNDLTTHAVIQQQQRLGATGEAVFNRPVPGQRDQVSARFWVKKASADHARTRAAAELIRKGLLRVTAESGYTCERIRRKLYALKC